MARALNLEGMVCGRLTVLYRGEPLPPPDYLSRWYCRCSCKDETVCLILQKQLRNGKTRSCGCLQREMARLNTGSKPKPHVDLDGNKFGRLTVESYAGRIGKNHCYLCICSCEDKTRFSVRYDSLVSGNTRSCGCLSAEMTGNRARTHGLSHTKEYIAFKARERLERKRNLDGNWTLEMDEALRIFQPECVLCGADKRLTVDHVYALSAGHGLFPGNAVVLCTPCNSSKLNRSLEELAPNIRHRLLKSAKDFLHYWESRNSVIKFAW